MKKPQASTNGIEDFMSILVNIGAAEVCANESQICAEAHTPNTPNHNEISKPKIANVESDANASSPQIAPIIIQDISQFAKSATANFDIGMFHVAQEAAPIEFTVNEITSSSANNPKNNVVIESPPIVANIIELELANLQSPSVAMAENSNNEIYPTVQNQNASDVLEPAAIKALEAIGVSRTADVQLNSAPAIAERQVISQIPAQNKVRTPTNAAQVETESEQNELVANPEVGIEVAKPSVVSNENQTNANLGNKPYEETSPQTLAQDFNAFESVEFELVQLTETPNQPEQNATAIETPRFIDAPALAATMMRKFQNGEKSFFIRLDPAELGAINIELKMGLDKKLRAVIAVEKPETLTELSQSLDNLAASLADAGMELAENGISFNLENSSDQKNNFTGFAANENQQQERRTAKSTDAIQAAPKAANENNDLMRTLSPHSQVWQRIRVSLVA
ncbi:MAG: hypothetical protein FD163_600 [Hyphomonadaceae bacterium]|nr:MAG: hypothetical protein FD163_600 [Hyphomonadaceae bacterium]